MARHDVYTTRLDPFTYRADCKSCAHGSPPLALNALGAWIGAHTKRKCNGCGHAGSSHYSPGSSGNACGTCGCGRYS